MGAVANASPRPSRATAHDSGADVDRFSFIARDLHPLLLAGLPALRKLITQRRLAEPQPAGGSLEWRTFEIPEFGTRIQFPTNVFAPAGQPSH
jgi:hypothetical protein